MTRGPAPLARVSWPLWIVASFCVYSLVLLWYTQQAQDSLRQSIDSRLIRESQRRADTLTAYIDDRRSEVMEIVERYEIEAYFINAALGMSQRYGLLANLVAIDDYFARKKSQRRVQGTPVFDQIILYDEHGIALSEGAPAKPPIPLSGGVDRVVVHFDLVARHLIIAAPVRFKNVYRGMLVTSSDLGQISAVLLGSDTNKKHQEFLLDSDGTILARHLVSLVPDKAATEALARLPPNRLSRISSMGIEQETQHGTLWVIRSEVASTPLSLITVLDDSHIYGALDSRFVLVSLGIFPFLLLAATLAFQRQRSKSQALESDNLALAEEIARRQALEQELQAKNASLEALTVELQSSVRIAEQANRAKSDFLATMSHEIRTPMNGILGMAQVLDAHDLPESERRDCIRIINESGRNLLALLNDILDLSKVEAGKLELRLAECRPALVLRDCAQLYAEVSRSKGLNLLVKSEVQDDVRILADGERLHQMLGNLIGNAVKFTHHGEIRVSLREIATDGDTPDLEFSVQDSGIGIAREEQAKLFQPFTQVDSSTTRQFGGTGLGLTIVRRMVELMGGDIGVESSPGQGSRFWFRIPTKRLAMELPMTEMKPANEPDKNAKLSGTVLLADDNMINRKVIEVALTYMGLRVIQAQNGREVLDLFSRQQGVDVILMDMRMPEMDGIEATGMIRQLESERSLPRCPIIAFTANAYGEDRERCMEAGMDDFLAKPISIDKLRRAMQKWLPAGGADKPPETATASSFRPVDFGRAAEALASLLPLLDQHLFDGISRFDEFLEMLAGTSAELPAREIRDDLGKLDFNSAVPKLRALAAREGWQLP